MRAGEGRPCEAGIGTWTAARGGCGVREVRLETPAASWPSPAARRGFLLREPLRLRPGRAGAAAGCSGHPAHDRGAADQLDRPGRVAEQDDPGHGTDQRLDVDEHAGDHRGDPALPVGEQGERSSIQASTSPAVARAGPGRPATGGRPSVSAENASEASAAPANCTAVTATGFRPRSSRGWATVNPADSSSEASICQRIAGRAAAARPAADRAAAGDQADAGQRQRETRPRRPAARSRGAIPRR